MTKICNDDFLLAEQIMYEEAEETRLDDAFDSGRAYRSKIMLAAREMMEGQDIDFQEAFWQGFYD